MRGPSSAQKQAELTQLDDGQARLEVDADGKEQFDARRAGWPGKSSGSLKSNIPFFGILEHSLSLRTRIACAGRGQRFELSLDCWGAVDAVYAKTAAGIANGESLGIG